MIQGFLIIMPETDLPWTLLEKPYHISWWNAVENENINDILRGVLYESRIK